jgi:hypothetical protein
MMHRHRWTGSTAPSNTCFAWFVWDERSEQKRIIDWFDWKLITSEAAGTKVGTGVADYWVNSVEIKRHGRLR